MTFNDELFIERLFKYFREGCLEFMSFPRSGMDEAEFVGMEAETAQRIVVAAVFFVAHDGMAHVLGVDADLVFASCIEMEVHQ